MQSTGLLKLLNSPIGTILFQQNSKLQYSMVSWYHLGIRGNIAYKTSYIQVMCFQDF